MHEHEIPGRCHCGNLSFTLMTAKGPAAFTPRQCACTLCQKHGASWIADPAGHGFVSCRDAGQVSRYRFGHATADFLVCRECGVLVAAACELGGKNLAVFNVRAMAEGTFSTPPVMLDIEYESVADRLARRAKSWTTVVFY